MAFRAKNTVKKKYRLTSSSTYSYIVRKTQVSLSTATNNKKQGTNTRVPSQTPAHRNTKN